MNKMKKNLLIKIGGTLLTLVLVSCHSKTDTQQEVNLYEGLKTIEHEWEEDVVIIDNYHVFPSINVCDDKLCIAVSDSVRIIDIEGNQLECIHLDSCFFTNMYYKGLCTWSFDQLNHTLFQYNNDGTFTKDQITKNKVVSNQNQVYAVGNNRFAWLDVDSISNTYRLYTRKYFIENESDSTIQHIDNDYSYNELIGAYETIPCPRGEESIYSEIGTDNKGNFIAYCRYNSNFVVFHNDSIKIGKDYRNLPIAKVKNYGHDIRFSEGNCGIQKATLDDNYIYCVTPRQKSTGWYASGIDRHLDIYRTKNLEYVGSILLPEYENHFIHTINKIGDKLVVLYISNDNIKMRIFDMTWLNL